MNSPKFPGNDSPRRKYTAFIIVYPSKPNIGAIGGIGISEVNKPEQAAIYIYLSIFSTQTALSDAKQRNKCFQY